MEDKAPFAPKVLEPKPTGGSSSSSSARQPEPQSRKVMASPPRAQEHNLPAISEAAKIEVSPEDDFVPPTTRFGKMRFRMEQQEPSTVLLPMYIFSWKLQVCGAGCCAMILALIGVLTLLAAGSTIEVMVSYKFPQTSVDFTITEDMEGDINMWYDLPSVIVNQKRYIENTDPDVIELFPFMGKKKCKDTEAQASAIWRRVDLENTIRNQIANQVANDTWSALVQNNLAFKPCGLQSIAMFTDEYELRRITGGSLELLTLDQSDIYLKEDDDIFEGKIVEAVDANGPYLTIKGERSWIQAGNFYNHFKVWMRSPAAPHVRHLWAVIKGGLKKGDYRLTFLQNSAIWTAEKPRGWEVAEKRVVFSTQNTLGSKGASELMAGICFFIAALEIVAMVAFIVLGARSKDMSS